jgi:hypothetical protein
VELSGDGEWLKLDRREDIFTSRTRPQTKTPKSRSFLSDSDEEDEEDMEEDDDVGDMDLPIIMQSLHDEK